MSSKPTVAISIGDLNGVGVEIALRSHEEVVKFAKPIYCVKDKMLEKAANLLDIKIPDDFQTYPCGDSFDLLPGEITKDAGLASYESFLAALGLCKIGRAKALVTLPISMEAWAAAGISYKGHSEALSDLLEEKVIMMLGCEKLFVILYTEYIPIKEVYESIKTKPLKKFLIRLSEILDEDNIGVLGLNPHSSGSGLIGGAAEEKITKAIIKANKYIGKEVFKGPISPENAFTPKNLETMKYYVCMYHDQGLVPLKALYFQESVNISLGIRIARTSVDHGAAYDIAYKNQNPSLLSYQNALKQAAKLAKKKRLHQ